MRAAAILHVLLAAILAVYCWDVERFTWRYWEAVYIHATCHGPVDTFCMMFEMVLYVAMCSLYPFLYLWAVRYCTVRFAGRCETSALQKDMLILSEAASFLRQLMLKLPPPQQAAQSSRATNNPNSGPSTDAATELTDPAASNEVPDDQSERQDIHLAFPLPSHETCSSNPEKQQSSSLVNAAQKHSESHEAEQTKSLLQSKTAQELNITEIEAATSQASTFISGLTDDDRPAVSPALKLRAEKALAASTTMLAYLSARLEAYVYLQTGAHVQGNAACQAALDL